MKKCRFCSGALSRKFVDLGYSPIANSFLKKEDLQRGEMFYPLVAYVCARCWLVQVEEIERAENIFTDDYAYFSSFSATWLAHAKKYAADMIRFLRLGAGSLVAEIGSNDGYLLQYFKRAGIPVFGIEPAENVARAAMAKGIRTEIAFFNARTAGRLASKGLKADLIVGNNVLAHVPRLNDFVQAMGKILKPEGIITMEFPHLLNLIRKNQFDTIYHEHFSYFSFHTVKKIFEAHRLDLFDVDRIPTHGGSLRIYARHRNNLKRPVSKRVTQLLSLEKREGLQSLETYTEFQKKVEAIKCDLLSFLIRAKRKGKRVMAYGAPAKGNTLLNHCGVKTDLVSATVDRSPHKQGFFLPGTRIPIEAPGFVKRMKPHYLLILPWNIKEEIMDQMSAIQSWGGKFITAIPRLRIHR